MFVLGCALSPNFAAYYCFRALVGFCLGGAQTLGLAYVQDMFFLHQRARTIGILTIFFLGSPFFGPMFGYLILNGTSNWRNAFWLAFGAGCLEIVLIGLFLDESWYRRDLPGEDQPPWSFRLSRVIGLWQLKHRKYFLRISTSCRRLILVFLKPIIIPTMIH